MSKWYLVGQRGRRSWTLPAPVPPSSVLDITPVPHPPQSSPSGKQEEGVFGKYDSIHNFLCIQPLSPDFWATINQTRLPQTVPCKNIKEGLVVEWPAGDVESILLTGMSSASLVCHSAASTLKSTCVVKMIFSFLLSWDVGKAQLWWAQAVSYLSPLLLPGSWSPLYSCPLLCFLLLHLLSCWCLFNSYLPWRF